MVEILFLLNEIRHQSGEAVTMGLSDEIISEFVQSHSALLIAVEQASIIFKELLRNGIPLEMDENELVSWVQEDYINFYASECINPYVAIAACGPWIVTSHGAVIHDNGGYGMISMGHAPEDIIRAMSKNWVMANVMTPSFSQRTFATSINHELGHTRRDFQGQGKQNSNPFSRIVCMNSGSESVTVSLRIADVNANNFTGRGGRYEGRPIKLVALKDGFHGRTDRPAQISDSCKSGYDSNLASFRGRDNLIVVPPNDIEALRAVFARADEESFFIELMAMEPVQGEGNPGMPITRDFYDEARRLTLEHGSLLLIDSIQAGFRCQGCLSIIDYEGFQDAEPPDMETWSKALNAGQYPLSVLGLNERAAKLYVVGIYGNTMTTNPRALETASAVLNSISPDLRDNIRQRGREFLEKLENLAAEFPDSIMKVQGTGLLLSTELNPKTMQVVGFGKVEEWCRNHGLGIIHGGTNALRFTPHFAITSKEIDLIIGLFRDALLHFTNT